MLLFLSNLLGKSRRFSWRPISAGVMGVTPPIASMQGPGKHPEGKARERSENLVL